MTNEREEEQRGEAADNEYERRKDNECDAEREREGKAMKLNIEELKQKALAVASKNWIEGNSYCEISDDSGKFVAQAYRDSRADAIANAAFIAAASPVPAPAVTEYMVPFTDNDLAEIHQLAYEIGGTDSGEYILDGEQLDQVIVKAASLFYKPAGAVPAVPNALQMEREWLEGWLHCMAEPMVQMCCGRSMFKCCGSPDPVYPDLSYISASMSKRRTEIIALLQSTGEKK